MPIVYMELIILPWIRHPSGGDVWIPHWRILIWQPIIQIVMGEETVPSIKNPINIHKPFFLYKVRFSLPKQKGTKSKSRN